MKNNKTLITIVVFIIALAFLIFASLFIYFKINAKKTSDPVTNLIVDRADIYKDGIIKLGKARDQVIKIQLVSDIKSMQNGLSGRKMLPEDSGMLFNFGLPLRAGIWMKDMNFPLDIIWLDKDFKILHIEKSLKPETYPKIYGTEFYSNYVLEINAGLSEKNDLKVGDSLIFNFNH